MSGMSEKKSEGTEWAGGGGSTGEDCAMEMSEEEEPLEHWTWPGYISSSFLITSQLTRAAGQGPSPDLLWWWWD